MFEAVRNNKRIAQIILGILIIPFAFFGMDAYFSDSATGNEVAKVGGTAISAYDFDQAVREQQDRLRANAGGQVDRALLDSPELRRAVLDNLINQRVLALYAAENRLVVTPQQLQETIAGVPAFQEDGRFSLQRYENLVRAQGMSPATFEARLAQDVRIQQIVAAVGDAGFVPEASARRFLDAQLESRRIREFRLAAARLGAEAAVSDAQVAAYYEANPARFERPARLQAEYLVFDRAAIERKVEVADDAVIAFYEGNPQRFGVPEERQARHILLTLADGAEQAEVDKVMAEAKAIVDTLRQDPARFAELAREKSQDPGSASRGGDLGFFGRGMMVGAFEDAVFSLEKGKISDPVRSEFGVHIIEVTDIKPSSIKPLADVRDEIVAELRGQEAGRRFAELAEQFANTVYEQPESLVPAAEVVGLEVRTSDWISRDAAPEPFNNERLLNAVFSDEATQKGRNTDAIEVGNGTLVAARVKTFEAAQRLPLDEVRGRIVDELKREKGRELALAQGEAALVALRKGEPSAAQWGDERVLQRAAPGLPAVAMQAVFSAPAEPLPGYVGVQLPEGDYIIYRIDAVERPQVAADDPRVAAVSAQYAQLLAGRDFGAFLSDLRQRYEVEVNASALQVQQ
ncbi:MAG TPA: peptidylprolyl isomerase [Rhodocyclaceae bacterium]|nr:peptidylprolyl isomerase [Rhodocyclaceae bacterium]